MSNKLSTIWENTDSCAEHYRCATALYLMSRAFSVIIDRGISASVHGGELLDFLNAIDKRFTFQLMSNVQLPGEKGYDTKMVMHNGTRTSDVSLAREFQKHLSTAARKYGMIDQGKYRKL